MKTPEEIKKGLECCTAPMLAHDDCPYKADRNPFDVICKDRVMEDALALIQQLEAKLAEYEKPIKPLTLEEALELKTVWYEPYYTHISNLRPIIIVDNKPYDHSVFCIGIEQDSYMSRDLYGKVWRCWSRKPTDEERKAVKWDG